MGGYGSGRTGGRYTLEGCGSFPLSMKTLRPYIREHGNHFTATYTFAVGSPEELAVTLMINMRDPHNPSLTLMHQRRTDAGGLESYCVWFERHTPNYGGVRWYFVCPRTMRRVTKLWLPRGGHQFWSRQAYRLDYVTQREDAMGRAQRRMMKLHRAMGGDGSYDDEPPPKAKWRRWAKYERQAEAYDALAERVDLAFMFRAARIVATHDARMARLKRRK